MASDVSISGTVGVGQVLTGDYTYTDADGDAEGTSTFRWLSDGTAIPARPPRLTRSRPPTQGT